VLDTKYTWLFDDAQLAEIRSRVPVAKQQAWLGSLHKAYERNNELRKMSVEELLGSIDGFPATQAVVLTGGEPLIHQRQLLPLLDKLVRKGLEIEFETNGTISPELVTHPVHFNVSPKLANSYNQSREQRYKPDVLREFLSRDSIFKYVVSDEADLEEVQDMVADVGIPAKRVFLMPEGTSSHALSEKTQWLVDVCKRFGYNYTHRLHLVLFGNKRGT